MQEFPCANGCSTPLTVVDDMITINVDGHVKAAHRECPLSDIERIATVLAKHTFYPGLNGCVCGWKFRPISERFEPGWKSLPRQHTEHVAERIIGEL